MRNFFDFRKNKGIDLEKGTIENLSEISRHPDIIIYSYVMEHLDNPIKELKTLRNFLNGHQFYTLKFLEF
jgi:hypothetical protein